MKNNIFFSIIIPVYNEQDSIFLLHKELKSSLLLLAKPFEIIFVNDGSNDRTLDNLKLLKSIKIINFRKNFGQTSAIDAGIKNSSGEYLIFLDGDGQNNPADIEKMFNKLIENDLDIISGWRRDRKDNFFKCFFSKIINLIRRFLIDDGINDSGCTLKIYKRECFEGINLYGEMHRFIPAILKNRGFKIGEIEVSHRPRVFGKTKYNWKRSIKGILDLLSVWFWYKYSQRPLHLFGGLGIILILGSVISGFIAVYLKIFKEQSLSDTALTDLTMFLFFIGFLMLIFGLMADLLSRIYFNTSQKKHYSIKEIIENE